MTNPIQLPLHLMNITIEIPLTRGYSAIVDSIDVDLVGIKWFVKVDVHTCYALRNFPKKDGKITRGWMHRIILERTLGRELLPGEFVDHINGDGLNNRRSNLRLATASQNHHNSRRAASNTSGFKGVFWYEARQKWRAQIHMDGKQIYLGSFDTPEQAYAVYCEAAKELHREFARLE